MSDYTIPFTNSNISNTNSITITRASTAPKAQVLSEVTVSKELLLVLQHSTEGTDFVRSNSVKGTTTSISKDSAAQKAQILSEIIVQKVLLLV